MTIIVNGSSPVKEITFGQATKFSLDNYYEILKEKAGQLAAGELLQLKVVADTIDLTSDENILASKGGYTWFSYFNLLNRSDRAVEPLPVSGGGAASLVTLVSVYGKFLSKLRKYVVLASLSPDDQKEVAKLDEDIKTCGSDITKLYIEDRTNWKNFAEAMGYRYGDDQAYVQWVKHSGNLEKIQALIDEIQIKSFRRKTLLDRKYQSKEDEDVIAADFAFSSPSSRLRYPVYPDFQYTDGDDFKPVYLARLPLGSTAIFDDRHAMSWDKTLKLIKTNSDGAFTGVFDRSSQESKSISTDWKASGRASYGFLSARASASESVSIQEDFKKALKLTVGAKAAFRININPPVWFKSGLFEHRYVKENPKDFEEFFGSNGSLRYYPTAIIAIRGFSVAFESSQNWTYDYKKSFSASGGGGFGAFGFSFGGGANYNSTVKEHKVDQAGTKLEFSDDPTTIRFVGYVVAQNSVYDAAIDDAVKNLP